jgi:spore germination protein (amino acid permease)
VEEKMTLNNTSISKFQFYFFIIQSQLGIGLLSLPNVVQSTAKGDGWISTLLAGVVVQITLTLYWFLMKRYPDYGYSEITQQILGRYIGKFCNIIIFIFFILTGSFALKLFILCVNLWLLPLTPMWVLSLIIILSCLYLTISDLRIIARFFVLASFLIILLFILSLFTFNLPKEFHYILPIGSSGVKNILLGSNKSLISMLGFEGFLIIFPYILNKKKGAYKTISFANLSVTMINTYFLLLCLVSFSPLQLKQIRYPVLFLFEVLSFEMVDRLDFIFLSIWIVPMTTSVIAYLYFSVKSISKPKRFKMTVWINALLMYCIAVIPMNEKQLDLFSTYVTYLSYSVVFALPVVLLCLSILIKKLEMSENT